jgi:Reverse transcriptase (RNA-dependent DNA polymerase)
VNSIKLAGWYVDDGFLAADSVHYMEHMVHDIGESFNIQDLGALDQLLGIKILRDLDAGTIHISQPSFINTITKQFNVLAGKPVLSPMDPTIKLLNASTDDDTLNIPYALLIGSINYCLIAPRPDIAYATNKCAQFTHKLTLIHWKAAKHIMRYLIHTVDHGILFQWEGKDVEGYTHNLAGFTDAYFMGDLNNRKSTTGCIFTFNGSPISWASKKQGLITLSSMESELIAGLIASVEGIWLVRLAKDFKHNFIPIPIFTDNQSFIAYSSRDAVSTCTKHLDTHFHYTCDQITRATLSCITVHLYSRKLISVMISSIWQNICPNAIHPIRTTSLTSQVRLHPRTVRQSDHTPPYLEGDRIPEVPLHHDCSH